MINTFVQFFPSLIIAQLLRSLTTEDPSWKVGMLANLNNPKGLVLAALLYTCLCTKTIIENQYFSMVTNLGAEVRGTISAAIYQKSLRLSPTGKQNNTVSNLF